MIEDAGRERRAVHHRHPGRHRRDPARPGRVAHRDCAHAPRAARRTCRRSSSRTSARSRAPRCRTRPDASVLEYVAAVAVARLVMGPHMRIQVPPNLSDPAEFDLLLRAGADDWGGVSPLTADHVNPERPWPHLDDLATRTAELGFELRERLTAHPEFVRDADDLDRPGAAAPRLRRSPTPRPGWPPPPRAARSPRASRRSHPPIGRSGRRLASSRRDLDARLAPSARPPIRSRSTTPSGSRCSRRRATTSTRSRRPPTTCAATRSARP